MELNEISGAVITAAMKVHTALGPGLLEEPYKQCLAYELKGCGLKVNVVPPGRCPNSGTKEKLVKPETSRV